MQVNKNCQPEFVVIDMGFWRAENTKPGDGIASPEVCAEVIEIERNDFFARYIGRQKIRNPKNELVTRLKVCSK